MGTPERSRWGVLKVLDHVGADHVIVMDDTERQGEQETCAAIERRLPESLKGSVIAAKRQTVYAGGAYRHAAYFGFPG